MLLGIASLTYRCGDDEVPTVFVRVSRFVSNFLPTVNLQITSSTEVVIVPEDRRAEPDYVRDSRATPSPIPNIGNGQDSPLYPGDASPSVTPGVGGLLDNSNSIGDDLPSLPTPVPSNFDESRAGDDSSSGLSGVAIAFIVLASIFVAIVILVCAYRFFHPRY